MASIFITGAIAVFVFMVLFFIIATIRKDNSKVDIGWGLGFIVLDLATLVKSDQFTPQSLLLFFIVLVWGLRLAGYIYGRNHGTGEDYRYAQWRKEWGKWVVPRAFLQVFMLQGVLMYIIGLPLLIVNARPEGDINVLSYIGTGLWVIGFFFEAVGDAQKSRFKKSPANNGHIMQSGLWRYTRHPNYFGEAMMWWGIFLIAVPSGWWYISIISPIMINFLIVKVSGVAMLEKKYEGNKEWYEYARRTSAFIPMPPKQ